MLKMHICVYILRFKCISDLKQREQTQSKCSSSNYRRPWCGKVWKIIQLGGVNDVSDKRNGKVIFHHYLKT